MTHPVKSKRGVYYDLNKSPYVYESPYGDLFKFSSKKKLEIYTRDIPKEIERLNKIIDRYNMGEFLPVSVIDKLKQTIYKAFYKQVER